MFQDQSGYKPTDLVLTSSYLLWLFICCKTKLRKLWFFLKKYFVFFYKNIHYFQKKMFSYGKKSFILKNVFTEKNIFYREKYKWQCSKIYISFQKYIFTQSMFVLQIKYKSFLNIYFIVQKKKKLFDLKKLYIC